MIPSRLDFPLHTVHRWFGHREIKIRRLHLDHRFKKILNIYLGHPSQALCGSSHATTDNRGGPGGAEKILIHTLRLGLFPSHQPARDEVRQGHVHGLHTVFLAHLHRAGNLVDFALSNKIAHRGGSRQNLQRRDAPSRLFLEQSLREHGFDRFSELSANLSLLAWREHVDDTVNRFRRAGSV